MKKTELTASMGGELSKKEKIQKTQSLFEDGTQFYNEKRFEEAEAKLKEALNFAPASEDVMYNLALVYLEQKKYELALELVNKIEEIDCEEIVKVLKKAGYANITVKRPIKWFNLYTYGIIPLSIIFLIVQAFIAAINYSRIQLPFISLISKIVIIIMFVCLVIGLHKRRLWGWILNWIAIVVETFLIPIIMFGKGAEKKDMADIILMLALWLIPNFIYFARRKSLFA